MTNDNTNLISPRWYQFLSYSSEGRINDCLHGWFDTEEDAKKYELILNLSGGINLYSASPLDAKDFREIATMRADEEQLPLCDEECEPLAEMWLQKVCVMTSESLREYLRR